MVNLEQGRIELLSLITETSNDIVFLERGFAYLHTPNAIHLAREHIKEKQSLLKKLQSVYNQL